ncbi:MAG: YggS family pyridoxal phosphate-dependent enzyme [bacterium]|nr:YggS family pyridoxal phosphate-dependent enzyme [bacterium]
MDARLVAGRLAAVRERIGAACGRAGRDRGAVRLVTVTKQVPLPLVLAAVRAGAVDLGENRVLEAMARQDELARLLADGGDVSVAPRWHFIGHLQRNKAARAAGRFALLHGVDSAELAGILAERATAEGRREPVLLEVNVSGEPQKHGVHPQALPELLDAVAALPGIDLLGFMGMAAYGVDEADARRAFAGLRELAARERARTGLLLPELSMGMSGDFEAAVLEGATIVRVGGAIFAPGEG